MAHPRRIITCLAIAAIVAAFGCAKPAGTSPSVPDAGVGPDNAADPAVLAGALLVGTSFRSADGATRWGQVARLAPSP